MFGFPNIDFTTLYYSSELDKVGIESTTDLVKPAIIAILKDGIQRHVTACNLSKSACNELIEAFEDEGIEITLDENLQPDAATLPLVFSDVCEEAVHELEEQKARNYASWIIDQIDKIEIDKSNRATEDTFPEIENRYPVNLFNAIFGSQEKYNFLLSDIMREEADNILETLTPLEEKILRARYQNGVTCEDIIQSQGLQNNMVGTWAIKASVEEKEAKALRKLRHPSRAKRVKGFLSYLSYLENVDGATLEDIGKSFLLDRRLSWTTEMEGERTIDWVHGAERRCLHGILDVCTFPANLIYNALDFDWNLWPTGLLRESALTVLVPHYTGGTVQKAYFSTNKSFGHYLLVVGQRSNSEEFYELLSTTDGVLQVEAPILKNLCRIIEENGLKAADETALRTLYNAEQLYVRDILQQVSDPREKEFYQLFLDLISEQLRNLPDARKRVLGLKIEDLDLSVPSFNCLRRAGIKTVEDLVAMSEDELMRVRNLRRKSFEEVLCKIKMLGLELKPDAE